MLDAKLQEEVIGAIVQLKNRGFQILLVHGGGPFIAEQLDLAQIESEFVEGHRKTSKEAMIYVEMALKGRVNGRLVSLFNQAGSLALGLSGKDVQTIKVVQRKHIIHHPHGQAEEISLGQVGDVVGINTPFIQSLLDQNITPILACIGIDDEGADYNINADMVAGHVAGALKTDYLLMLTDIEGLRRDVNRPDSLIPKLTTQEAKSLFGTSIQGGMIPKVEACIEAVRAGTREAVILNGTKPELLFEKIIQHQDVGTSISA